MWQFLVVGFPLLVQLLCALSLGLRTNTLTECFYISDCQVIQANTNDESILMRELFTFKCHEPLPVPSNVIDVDGDLSLRFNVGTSHCQFNVVISTDGIYDCRSGLKPQLTLTTTIILYKFSTQEQQIALSKVASA